MKFDHDKTQIVRLLHRLEPFAYNGLAYLPGAAVLGVSVARSNCSLV